MTEPLLPHILIVDDEPEIRTMISLCLTKCNFRITTAGDVSEACKILVQEQFDVIISDVMMPGEDGIAFLGRVHELWPDIPVILMTGHAQLQMAVNAIKKGAFDFICKPFDFDLLRKIILRAVNYSKLQVMERNYRTELEMTVARKTAELKASMAELDQAREALQKAATIKSAFMATVSHEMRTPMNGVIGALELLADENLSGAGAGYLAMAHESAENMLQLINQMLSFSMITSPKVGGISHDLLDPRPLVTTVVDKMRPLFTKKGVQLSLSIAEDVPQQIRTDYEKVRRLFEILLGNSLKFTDRGTVSLELSSSYSESEGEMLLCTVSDTGIGIPEGMLEQIFEPFVQGESSLARRYEGVGLGLSIARQNASLLNGHIWAEHLPSGGSRFSVLLKISSP